MDYIIEKCGVNETKEVDILLNKLILGEKQYDKNISDNFIVKEFYETKINDDNNCILVAKIDNKIIGYLYGFILNSDIDIEQKAQLDALYVEEEYRKLGIANSLINEFINWAKLKQVKFIELNVCNENINAINLYKKYGFKDIKTIMCFELGENYYEKNSNK